MTAKPAGGREPDAKLGHDLVEARIEFRSPKSLRGHREAVRIPSMSVDEAAALEGDIAENGIQLPLDVTPAGVVLDGRHRHRAALRLGLDSVPVRVVEPPDEVEYMFRMALLRRHLSAGQKALAVLGRDEYRTTRAAAETRKRANLRNGALDVATLPHRGRSRALAAERAGVSERTVQHAITVTAHGDPDLVEQVASGKLSVEKAAREVKRRARYARIGEAPPLPAGLFDLIYADPPWWLSSAADHYPLMRTDAIAAMRIPAAEAAVLFMWEVTGMRADAMAVIDPWGFTFKTELVWVKPSIGTGNWVRNRHEKLLIATRPDTPTPSYLPDSVIEAPRGRHSEKPKIFHELIEQMYPHATRLELFARGKRPGWTSWGNEVPA